MRAWPRGPLENDTSDEELLRRTRDFSELVRNRSSDSRSTREVPYDKALRLPSSLLSLFYEVKKHCSKHRQGDDSRSFI